MSLNRNETKKNWPCKVLLMLVPLLFIISLTLNGCVPVKSSVVYVPDSQRIELLDFNDPAPYKGILLTEGYFFRLKECEGLAIEYGLIRP